MRWLKVLSGCGVKGFATQDWPRPNLACVLLGLSLISACAGGDSMVPGESETDSGSARQIGSLRLETALLELKDWKPQPQLLPNSGTEEIPVGLQSSLRKALSEALKACSQERFVAGAPDGNGAAVNDLTLAVQGDGSVELGWSFRNPGDYDQNSQVNISDLTPVGVSFQENTDESDWPKHEPVDGDGNGEINIADVTPIGQHFQAILDGYALEYTLTPANESSWQPVPAGGETLEAPYGSSVLPDGGGRRTFSLVLPSSDPTLIDQTSFRVRPYAGSAPAREYGPASNVVQLGGPVSGAPEWSSTTGITSAVAGDSKVTVAWGEATDADFPPVHYIIYYNEGTAVDFGTAQTAVVDAPALSTEVSGLTNETEYAFAVRARDSDVPAHEDNNEMVLTATPTAPKFPPVATLDATPDSGPSPLTAAFDASQSSDPDGGAIQNYEWDADGIADNGPLSDGFELDSGAVPTLELLWYSTGQHAVRVRVTDDEGVSAIGSKSVPVSAGATWHVDYPVGNTPIKNNIGVNDLQEIEGLPALLTIGTGPPPDDRPLLYVRALNPQGSDWAAPTLIMQEYRQNRLLQLAGKPVVITHYPYPTAKFRIFTATDVSGSVWNSATIWDGTPGFDNSLLTVFMTNGTPALIAYQTHPVYGILFIRAQDSQGVAWDAPKPVQSGLGFTPQPMDYSGTVIAGNPALAVFDQDNEDLLFMRATDTVATAWNNPVTVDYLESVGQSPSLIVIEGRAAIAYYDSTQRVLKFTRALDIAGTQWTTPLQLDRNAGEKQTMALINNRPAIIYFWRESQTVRFITAMDEVGEAWDTPQLVDGSLETTAVNSSGDQAFSLATAGGIPQVAYTVHESGDGFATKHAALY